eukprot:3943399-Pyramimonas_sp.AAC.1
MSVTLSSRSSRLVRHHRCDAFVTILPSRAPSWIGHMVNKAGSSFEVSCFQAVADRYGLLSREGQLLPREGPAGDIRVLRNVRLARSNEVDMM